MKSVNVYGDKRNLAKDGYGIDIATQRADDLDLMAIKFVDERSSTGHITMAMDIGCGQGGQTIRMAKAGALVTALDITDYEQILRERAYQAGVSNKVTFIKKDMRAMHANNESFANYPVFDAVICQRAIHYLTFNEAVEVISSIKKIMAGDGKLFISASGLLSELGNNYKGMNDSVTKRYTPLSHEMIEKHGIHGKVCLYSLEDMNNLLTQAGLETEHIFISHFGNIKAVANCE